MSESERAGWDQRHRGKGVGEPEPFLAGMIPRIPRRSIALDFSETAMRTLAAATRTEHLAVWPVVANLDSFHLKQESLDAIININFLDRALFAEFSRALRPGGVLIAETFTIEQASLGHPKDPRFLLGHGELKELVAGLEIEHYREGLVTYPDDTRAFRASIVARKAI